MVIDAPDSIPEPGQLLLILRVESEFRFRVNDDPWVKSSTTEHHRQLDMGISVEDPLWIPS